MTEEKEESLIEPSSEPEYPDDLVYHISELMRQVVEDDPMYANQYGSIIEAAWDPAKLSETITTQLIGRAFLLMI